MASWRKKRERAREMGDWNHWAVSGRTGRRREGRTGSLPNWEMFSVSKGHFNLLLFYESGKMAAFGQRLLLRVLAVFYLRLILRPAFSDSVPLPFFHFPPTLAVRQPNRPPSTPCMLVWKWVENCPLQV